MIQVLNDLRTFAELNEMDELADKLYEARDLAHCSLPANEPSSNIKVGRHGAQSRRHDGEAERHH